MNVVLFVFFFTRWGNYRLLVHRGKILESPMLHLIRPTNVDIPKLIKNVPHWASKGADMKSGIRYEEKNCFI